MEGVVVTRRMENLPRQGEGLQNKKRECVIISKIPV